MAKCWDFNHRDPQKLLSARIEALPAMSQLGISIGFWAYPGPSKSPALSAEVAAEPSLRDRAILQIEVMSCMEEDV